MSATSDEVLDALIERLAAIEHARWAHWQSHMHKKATPTADGGLLI